MSSVPKLNGTTAPKPGAVNSPGGKKAPPPAPASKSTPTHATNGKKVDDETMAVLRPENHSTLVNDPAAQAAWTSKKLVWVPHDVQGFVAASIREDGIYL